MRPSTRLVRAYPTEPDVTWITFYSQPDHLGRRRFSLRWRSDHPSTDIYNLGSMNKGQHFFTNPASFLAGRPRVDGSRPRVIIVDEQGYPVPIDHVEAA